MYVPGLNTVLGVEPVPFELWLHLLGLALTVLVVMELHKLVHRRWGMGKTEGAGPFRAP